MTIEQAETTDQPEASAADQFSDAWDDEPWTSKEEPKREPEPEPEKKKEPEPEPKKEISETETQPDDKKESTPDEKEEPEFSAAQRAEKRAANLLYPDEEEEKATPDDKQESTPSDTKSPEKEEPTSEKKTLPEPTSLKIDDPVKYVKERIASLEDGDRKTKLDDLVEGYPEIADLAVLVAQAAAPAKTEAPSIPDDVSKKLEAAAAAVERLEKVETELQERRDKDAVRDYFDAIEQEIPGTRKLVRTEGFKEWLKGQTVGVRALAETGDPEDGISVIQVYQEQQAKDKAREHDEEKSEAAKTRNAGLRSLGSSKRDPEGKRGTSEDDFDAGWNDEPPERYR